MGRSRELATLDDARRAAADGVDAARFRPEFGWTYETGVKSAWADDRLVANLSLYYTLISNYQDVHRVGLAGFTIRNARRSTSRGLDFDLVARPAAGLEITGGAGYIDAHYDDFRTRRPASASTAIASRSRRPTTSRSPSSTSTPRGRWRASSIRASASTRFSTTASARRPASSC